MTMTHSGDKSCVIDTMNTELMGYQLSHASSWSAVAAVLDSVNKPRWYSGSVLYTIGLDRRCRCQNLPAGHKSWSEHSHLNIAASRFHTTFATLSFEAERALTTSDGNTLWSTAVFEQCQIPFMKFGCCPSGQFLHFVDFICRLR